MKIAISQPMYFPWVGQFEKIRLADIFVHYDDVPFSKGSFTNRVQIKTVSGSQWLTVPLRDVHLGQRICDVRIDERQHWRARHLALLHQHYQNAPFYAEAVSALEAVLSYPTDSLAEVAIASLERMCQYFDIKPPGGIVRSSKLSVSGQRSQRLRDIVLQLGGTTYLCGYAGASRYLDVALLEAAGIQVECIRYESVAYPQLHGQFTPAVSALDLIANAGSHSGRYFISRSVPWKDALPAPHSPFDERNASTTPFASISRQTLRAVEQ